jgi:hypothetical protein
MSNITTLISDTLKNNLREKAPANDNLYATIYYKS